MYDSKRRENSAHISPGDVVHRELALAVQHRGPSVVGEVRNGPNSHPGGCSRQHLVGLCWTSASTTKQQDKKQRKMNV